MRSEPARISCGHLLTLRTHETFPTEHITVPNVTMEVLDGELAGRAFVTDANGRVTLPAVGDLGFRALFKKSGFENLHQTISIPPRESELGVALVPEPGSRIELSGVCSNIRFGRTERVDFAQVRNGLIRFSVRLLETPVPPSNANIVGSVSRVGLGAGFPPIVVGDFAGTRLAGQESFRPTGEARFTHGPHAFFYSVSDCGPGTRWSLTLEYAR